MYFTLSPMVVGSFDPHWDGTKESAAWVHQEMTNWVALTGERPAPGSAAELMMKSKLLDGGKPFDYDLNLDPMGEMSGTAFGET